MYVYRSHIIISRSAGENTNQIVMDISEAVGIDIDEEDISISHRLPSKAGSRLNEANHS